MSEITDLATRDEYLEASLKAAARIIWLIDRAKCQALQTTGFIPEFSIDPDDEWLAAEAEELWHMLDCGPNGGPEEYRVLEILGVTQAWISSSARVERANQTSIDVSGRTDGM